MSAGLVSEPVGEPGRPSSLGIDAPTAAPDSRPVLSVSPDAAARHAAQQESQIADRRAFLTPRVIDQSAFDELATSLRGLIDEANGATTQLASRLDEARGGENESTSASVQLQERLRLGARMLKAFQTQIARVEQVVGEFDGREARLDTVQQRIDAALSALERKSNDMLGRARDEAEEVATDAAKCVRTELDPIMQRVERMQEQLNESAGRAEEIERRVEASEVSMAALNARAGEAAAKAQSVLAAISDSVGECDESRRRLASDLEMAATGIEDACGRGGQLADELQKAVARAATARDDLDDRLEDVGTTRQGLDELVMAAGRMDGLLARLEPWKPLLLGPPRNGLPEPVSRLVDELRNGVTRDLGRLAMTMRSVAERVEELTGERRLAPTMVRLPELRISRQSSRIPDMITVVEGTAAASLTSEPASSPVEGGRAV